MSTPKITIITPSYNQGQYLEQTITSVLEQSYLSLEYIIIDGGSTDNSLEIIKKYAKHLAYWVSEKDRGQSHAINKGLQRATGEVFNWLNADDYYQPHCLKTIGEFFNNPSTHVVIGRSRIFHDVDNKTAHYSNGTDVYKDNLAKTIGWPRIDQPETFFRTEALQKAGFINENFHYIMDMEWWMRYLLHFGLEGIEKISEILVNFRLHPTSKSVSQKEGFLKEKNILFYNLASLFKLASEKQILEKNLPSSLLIDPKHYLNVDKSLVQAAIHYHLLYQADSYYYHHQPQATRLYLKAIDNLHLQKTDQELLKKIKYRSQWPLWLIKFVRFLKNLKKSFL